MDDYQQSWDGLRRQIRAVLWEEAVRQTGVPHYLGAPDDLKLLLMKAQNRKAGSHTYRVHDRSRLSFQGYWYVCPGLLSRLSHREFEIYYDRRDISVIYLFVDGFLDYVDTCTRDRHMIFLRRTYVLFQKEQVNHASPPCPREQCPRGNR